MHASTMPEGPSFASALQVSHPTRVWQKTPQAPRFANSDLDLVRAGRLKEYARERERQELKARRAVMRTDSFVKEERQEQQQR